MTVNCLCCGHKIDLGNAYGAYEGQVKCFACGALLELKTEDGDIRSVKFVKQVRDPGDADAARVRS